MYTLTIAVCDTDLRQMKILRSLLTGMAIRTNMEIHLLKFSQEKMREQVLQYSNLMNLVLISLDMQGGFELGCAVARSNPDCYLLFFRQCSCEIEPFLWARPIAFYTGELACEKLESMIVKICSELLEHADLLHYSTRYVTGVLPYRSIVCAESDRRHVKIHLINGEMIEVCQKLIELEKALSSSSFCRVHQSWLINLKHVIRLDKTQHLLHMRNNEKVPISKAYYEQTANTIKKLFEQTGTVHVE